MEPYRKHLTKLGPHTEAVLRDMVTRSPGIFEDVSKEEALTTLGKLQELLRRMEEASGAESRP